MVESKVIDVAAYLKQCLEQNGVAVSKVILFGSHARGRAYQDSDIDLIVVSESFRGKDIFERAELIGDAEFQVVKKYKVPIELLLKTPEEIEPGASITADYVESEGVVVWAA
jgi:predicted nucleotidyltransferase